MTRYLYMYVFVSCAVAAYSYTRLNLQQRPQPMLNFVPEKVAGEWYYQARFISHSWDGSGRLTNAVRQFDVTGNALVASTTFRAGSMCSTLVDERKFSPDNCAVQLTSDRIGSLYDGERVIISTDYTCYLIYWGCLQYTIADPRKCEDPTLSVQTRRRDPGPFVMKTIDKILHKTFGIKMADLVTMVHDNPC